MNAVRVPRLLAPFLAGFCGVQVIVALVADKPWWYSLIFGAISIWGILSWRVHYLEDVARWKRLVDEILEKF